MMEHSAHIPFIVAAYVIAGVVVGAMIGSIILDYMAVRRDLRRFGARGLDRE